MKKILYCKDVLGITYIWFSLHSDNKSLHDEFMKKVLELGYLEDITEIFDHVKDFEFIQSSHGFIVNEGKTYTFFSNEKMYDLRANEHFHKIIEEYNQKLKRPQKIEYKEVSEERYPSMVVTEWEDGSEHILFID